MDKKLKIPEGLDAGSLPRHVAIIMDGNGRWARQRLLQRTQGHSEGVHSVNRITRLASDMGISHLTLYAFSTENWNRPTDEVKALMHLIGETILREAPELKENNVHINLLGDIDRLPESVRRNLQEGCDMTAACDGMNLNLCLSYSSRWELTEAVKEIARLAAQGSLNPDDINENTISSHLQTAGIPDPDLLIRTGGEQRISNFLLWQIAYAELYFTPVLWPDFDEKAFTDALMQYQNRERRFGMTSDQITCMKK